MAEDFFFFSAVSESGVVDVKRADKSCGGADEGVVSLDMSRRLGGI